MATTTIRLKPATRKVLREIAEMTGASMQEALDRAVEERRRQLYLEGLNADYAALRQDPKQWERFREENAVWDVTNADGLGEV